MTFIFILCFGHIANKFNNILSILNEVIIFPETGDLFRIGNLRGIPGQIDQKFLKLTPSYLIKIWNLVYRVVWHAEDDWANIGALQAKVNEL